MKTRKFSTSQENFWAGGFGNEYTNRNASQNLLAANTHLFSTILRSTSGISSIIEFGANIGLNLQAIRTLLPTAKLSAIEINKQAVTQLKKNIECQVHDCSIYSYWPRRKYDLVLSKGVLIHLNPDKLSQVYQKLYRSSQKYICLVEYYNPSPIEVEYRGHRHKLYKRDFAGELLTQHPELRLLDYGFAYHRDANFPQDDLNWFLLEKSVTV